jgi:hypothetical protein
MTCGTKNGKPHIHTPLKAIRLKCKDCCCGSPQEVKLCPVKDCSLYPYRLGKHPNRTGAKGRVNPGLQKFQRIAKEEFSKRRE